MLLDEKSKSNILDSFDLPRNIRKVIFKLQTCLGSTFSFESLVDFISMDRSRPLRIITYPLGLEKSGFVTSFADADLVCIRDGMPQDKKLITCLHELSHLLLNHTKIREDRLGEISSDSEDYRLYHSIREYSYATIREKDAEALGTILFILIKSYEKQVAVPSYAWIRIKGMINE